MLGGPIVQNKAHFFVSLERQVDNPNRHARVCGAAGPRFLGGRRSDRLEHHRPLRSPDQREQHLGRALAARVGAAVVHLRHPPDQGIVPGRDRPRSDGGRHADERRRQRQGQYRPHGADLGALVARQRVLPRAGRRRATAPASSSAKKTPATRRSARHSSITRRSSRRPAPNRRGRGTRITSSRTTSPGSCPARRATTI